jgi:hypothetical protein
VFGFNNEAQSVESALGERRKEREAIVSGELAVS